MEHSIAIIDDAKAVLPFRQGLAAFENRNRKKNTPNENVTGFSPKIFDDCPLFLPALSY